MKGIGFTSQLLVDDFKYLIGYDNFIPCYLFFKLETLPMKTLCSQPLHICLFFICLLVFMTRAYFAARLTWNSLCRPDKFYNSGYTVYHIHPNLASIWLLINIFNVPPTQWVSLEQVFCIHLSLLEKLFTNENRP